MNINICPACGKPAIETTTVKGKFIRLDTSFSTTYPRRFVMKDGVAHFVDRFDQERGKQGYPSHYATCDQGR